MCHHRHHDNQNKWLWRRVMLTQWCCNRRRRRRRQGDSDKIAFQRRRWRYRQKKKIVLFHLTFHFEMWKETYKRTVTFYIKKRGNRSDQTKRKKSESRDANQNLNRKRNPSSSFLSWWDSRGWTRDTKKQKCSLVRVMVNNWWPGWNRRVIFFSSSATEGKKKKKKDMKKKSIPSGIPYKNITFLQNFFFTTLLGLSDCPLLFSLWPIM